MTILASHGIPGEERGGITTSDPLSVVSGTMMDRISRDSSESSWEEMDLLMAKESNMSVNALLLMAISGVFAVAGLTSGALELVLAAMTIAPGFEPLARISLGVVTNRRSVRSGICDTAKGYAALIAGAAATMLALRFLGVTPAAVSSAYLPAEALLAYWTSTSAQSVLVAAAAGIAGSLLIVTNRSMLTAGVMLAVSLIPTAAMAGMALAWADAALFAKALGRWGVQAGLIIVFSLLVFIWKRTRVQKRSMH